MRLDRSPTNQFKRDVRLAYRRGLDLGELEAVIDRLAQGEPLEAKARYHGLGGNYAGCRECHVAPDWLLVYQVDASKGLLVLARTGAHSDLFE